jgi:hypothetical protein
MGGDEWRVEGRTRLAFEVARPAAASGLRSPYVRSISCRPTEHLRNRREVSSTV